jgi:diamine N-acetyltransferase
MDTITFARIQPDEVDRLLDYIRDYYAYDSLPLDEPAAREAAVTLLKNPNLGGAWFVEHNGERAGYLVLTWGYSLEYHGRDAFIDELFIVDGMRGRGLGHAAIAFAAETCRRENIRALHLEVERHNIDAQAFYRRVGFVDHDRFLLTLNPGAPTS